MQYGRGHSRLRLCSSAKNIYFVFFVFVRHDTENFITHAHTHTHSSLRRCYRDHWNINCLLIYVPFSQLVAGRSGLRDVPVGRHITQADVAAGLGTGSVLEGASSSHGRRSQ